MPSCLWIETDPVGSLCVPLSLKDGTGTYLDSSWIIWCLPMVQSIEEFLFVSNGQYGHTGKIWDLKSLCWSDILMYMLFYVLNSHLCSISPLFGQISAKFRSSFGLDSRRRSGHFTEILNRNTEISVISVVSPRNEFFSENEKILPGDTTKAS